MKLFVIVICFITLVIIRASSKKINGFTAFLYIAILFVASYVITSDLELHDITNRLGVSKEFFVIVSISIIVFVYWIGIKLRNKKGKEGVMSKLTDKKGGTLMSNKTDEELTQIVSDFTTSSLYNRSIQHQSSSSNEDLLLTPEDFRELVNFSSALEEMKVRGMIEGEMPDITLHLTPADKDDDSEYIFNKSK